MTPTLKVQSGASCGNGLWHMGSIFGGPALPSGWMLVAALTAGWVFFLLMGVSSCLLSHATQKTKPGYILSVGKVISKKKALFSGGKTAVESFKRLNNCACSRSVSLAAECFGESSTESHLFVILSKPEQDGREL